MKDILEYKGYKGIIISEKSGSFSGEVIGIDKSLILFEGEDMDSLIQDFHKAVDDYLNMCKAHGRKPEKPSEHARRYAYELTECFEGQDDSVDYKVEAKKKPLTFRDVLNEDLLHPEFREEWIKLHQDPKTIKEYAETEGLSYDEAKDILHTLLKESLERDL